MKGRIRRVFCMLLAAAVMSGGLTQTVSAGSQETAGQEECSTQAGASRVAEENGVTVTTREQFLQALKDHKSPITVDELISIADGADTDNRMLPIKIPGGTVIQATERGLMVVRCPIQLEGDGVCFKDIELRFNSSDALGSVPHREIFLAGHSLILDNVSTYLEGGADLGSMGGTEKELLPTVYAGGYTGTQNGDNASLTVRNSNDKTMFQAIYLGHQAESDNKAPYLGNAVLNLDAKATVRGKVDAVFNSQAEITISGGANSYAKAKQIYGNENTTLTVNSFLEEAVVENVGNLVIEEGACLSAVTDVLHNVTLKSGACLDLDKVQNAFIAGNFVGAEGQERGILVLNENGTVMIQGEVSGVTTFQTKSRLFPGVLLVGKQYIFAKQGASAEANFTLPQASIDNGYSLLYNDGIWTVDGEAAEDIYISSIDILAAPQKVDLRKIAETEDGSIPNSNCYFEINWYDRNGQVFPIDKIEENLFYEMDYVIAIKTEYWQSEDTAVLEKTDWHQPVYLLSSAENPGRYYLQTYGDEGQAGDYTFLFCSEYYEGNLDTVADVKALKDTVCAEQRVIFYNQDIPDLEEHMHQYQESVTRPATCTEKGLRTYTCSCGDSYTRDIPAVGHQIVIDEEVAPTETEEGKTQGSHCSVCKTVIKKQEVIPATGGGKEPEEPEDPKDPEEPKDPVNPGEPGKPEEPKDPVNPGEPEEPEEPKDPVNPGEPEDPKDPANPEEPGEHTHQYRESVTKAATCADKGIKTYTCSCGDSYTRDIPMLGHKYAEKRLPATLDKNGSVQQVCDICSDTKTLRVIERVQGVALNKTDFIYNNKVVTPVVTVKDVKGRTLAVNRDYLVSYAAERKNPGVYPVTVTFMGDYSGKADVKFTIRPKGCRLGKITAKSKGFQAAWKKQPVQTSGYELQYCTARNFKGKTAKTVSIKKNTTIKKKVTKLKAKKKYFVRIRTYKTVKVDGKSKKLYSDWSKTKTVRTKK